MLETESGMSAQMVYHVCNHTAIEQLVMMTFSLILMELSFVY